MTEDLTRWFGEQLDEDERIARATLWDDDSALGSGRWHAYDRGPRDHWGSVRWVVIDGADEGVMDSRPQAADDEAVARHIAEHDPAQVLRDIQSDRILLAGYADAQKSLDAIAHPDMYDVGRVQGLEEAVRYRALRFSSRDGYREDWRP